MITFQVEALTPEVWDEALPLLHAHWREIARYHDIPLDPDLQTYANMAAIGALRLFTVRHAQFSEKDLADAFETPLQVRGRLAGYGLYFVRCAPHYRGSLQAVQDVLYLDPAIRGATGYRFIKWCDEQLREEGVQVVYQHVKVTHNFGPMLQRLGYEHVEGIYARRLDG